MVVVVVAVMVVVMVAVVVVAVVVEAVAVAMIVVVVDALQQVHTSTTAHYCTVGCVAHSPAANHAHSQARPWRRGATASSLSLRATSPCCCRCWPTTATRRRATWWLRGRFGPWSEWPPLRRLWLGCGGRWRGWCEGCCWATSLSASCGRSDCNLECCATHQHGCFVLRSDPHQPIHQQPPALCSHTHPCAREVLDVLSQSFEAETVHMAAVLRDWASSSNLMGV